MNAPHPDPDLPLIAAEAARVTQAAKDRADTPAPAAYREIHATAWPQAVPVRDLLRIIDGWNALAKATLHRFGAEALGAPSDAVRTFGALQAASRMGPPVFDQVRRSASDVVMAGYWSRHRIAYAVHPGLAESLFDTTGTGEIPAEVLRRLPHSDPLFLFPEGVPVTLSDGQEGLIRGFFVTGVRAAPGGTVRTSSADPDATGLQLSAFSQVGPAGLPAADWDLSSVSVPLSGRFTLEGAAGASADGWDTDAATAATTTADSVNAWTRTILRTCLPVLLYACSSEPDERRQPRPPAKRKAPQGAPRPARVLLLGYHVGPALLATVRARRGPPGGSTGRTVRAHLRRAHWHTYRTGPGRAETHLKWLPPIPVNSGGDAAEATVIAVR